MTHRTHKIPDHEYRKRLNIAQVEQRMNAHRQSIWRWYKPGQSGFCNFPKPHYLGQNRQWFEDEIQEWEQSRMAEVAESKSAA